MVENLVNPTDRRTAEVFFLIARLITLLSPEVALAILAEKAFRFRSNTLYLTFEVQKKCTLIFNR